MSYKDKEKQRAAWRRWYHNHKDQARAHRTKTHDALYEWFKEYKSQQKCKECGVDNPIVLDFHHRKPEEKKWCVSNMANRTSKARLLKEIDKCDVLCANCHRIVEHNKRQEAKSNKQSVG